MNNQEYAKIILNELNQTLPTIDIEKSNQFVDLLLNAKEIFCAGAGRSGFAVRGFAMRMMHM